jgi:Pyruvate-formate lyase
MQVLSPQEERIIQGRDNIELTTDEARASRIRVNKMLQALRASTPIVSVERAKLFTDCFKENEELPLILKWARGIESVANNIGLYIGPDELLIGRLSGTPGRYGILYPELESTCFTDPSTIVTSQKGEAYSLSAEDANVITNDLLPYWKGKTFREALFAVLPEDTRNLVYQGGNMCASANILQETATLRHSLQWSLDYDKVLKKGFKGIKKEAEEKLKALSVFDSDNTYDKYFFYQAVIIACDAIITLARRYAELAKKMAEKETDEARKKELLEMAEICEWVPENPARTFREAVQSQWFAQLGSRMEQMHGGIIGNGRIDQYLYSFYKKDIDEGRITDKEALELLECLWLKIAETPRFQPSAPGASIWEANAHYEQTTLGGLTPEGIDATNELSYLILRSKMEFPLNYPDLSVRIHSNTPQKFLIKVSECIKEGTGFPKLFNDEEVIPILLAKGAKLEEARDWCPNGCTEPRLINRNTYFSGTTWFNMAAVLEMALNDGRVQKLGQKRLGVSTGDPRRFATFEDMRAAFFTQLENTVKHNLTLSYFIDIIRPTKIAAPVLSSLHDLCMEEGKDVNYGKLKGAINLGPQVSIVGFGTVIDSLAAIKKLVYEDKTITMDELLDAMNADFEQNEPLRMMCVNAPKYGNGETEVDRIGRDIEEFILSMFDRHTNAYGGKPELLYVPITAHIPLGKVVGATPNGRKAGEPLSEGISPSQGADIYGPTVTLSSINTTKNTKYLNRAARLLNVKFSPQAVAGEKGTMALASLIRSWCDQKHWHIQFNIINRDTLIAAQKDPEKYRNLLVRVAGYSAYFVDLSKQLQTEIINRTEHQSA